MEPIEVCINDDRTHVYISQEIWGEDTEFVRVSPEQIATLIEWLAEARNELLIKPLHEGDHGPEHGTG